jgi:hypothetical protein
MTVLTVIALAILTGVLLSVGTVRWPRSGRRKATHLRLVYSALEPGKLQDDLQSPLRRGAQQHLSAVQPRNLANDGQA